jgi:hypothetical protein
VRRHEVAPCLRSALQALDDTICALVYLMRLRSICTIHRLNHFYTLASNANAAMSSRALPLWMLGIDVDFESKAGWSDL